MEVKTIYTIIFIIMFSAMSVGTYATAYYLVNQKIFKMCITLSLTFLATFMLCWSQEQYKSQEGIPPNIDNYHGLNEDLLTVYKKIHKKDNIIIFSKTSSQRAEIKDILLENDYVPKATTQTEIIYIKKNKN